MKKNIIGLPFFFASFIAAAGSWFHGIFPRYLGTAGARLPPARRGGERMPDERRG